MAVVPIKPLCHTVLGVCAAGEEHAGHIEAVAGGECQEEKNDEYRFVIHGEKDLMGVLDYSCFVAPRWRNQPS